MARPAKVTRILHSQGLNRSKYSRLSEMAVLCGQVRSDAWRRCSGVSTVRQSPYDVRDDWMAEGYDWHGLPARLGKAMLSDALGDMAAAREAAKVKVKRAIRHRTPERRCRTQTPLLAAQAESLDRGPVPAPPDAEPLEGRSFPCDEPDRGRQRFLHHEGLEGSGLGVPARHGERATHCHSAQGHPPAIGHPAHHSATQRAGVSPLRGGRNRGVQHAPLRGRHRGRGQGLHRSLHGQRRRATRRRVWETCWLRKAITKRTRANAAIG